MALLTHDYYCPKTGMASELRILLPDACIHGTEQPAGVLFLLPRRERAARNSSWKPDLPPWQNSTASRRSSRPVWKAVLRIWFMAIRSISH